MEPIRYSIEIADYIVLTIILLICIAVGIYTGRQKKGTIQNIDQFLLGSRKMHVIPVAFSIMATNLSAVTIAAVTAEVYLFGIQFIIPYLIYPCGIAIVGYFIVPMLHNHRYVSVYEYMEKRFDRKLRIIYSLAYIIGTMVFLGVVLYVPAVSLTVVSGLPVYVTVLGIGISCTLYCILGGYKAVIWTDVIQALLMMVTLVLFIIKGLIDTGGFQNIYDEAVSSGFLGITTWYDDINYRHSVLSLTLMSLYYSLKDVILNQSGAQRVLSLKNASEAKLSTYISAALTLVFTSLLGICGAIVYVHFHKCDPLKLPQRTGITAMEQLFVYAVVKFLHKWPGMAGLALSGILSGSISTLSSYINAFAALTLEDYMKRFCPKLVVTESRQIFACKILTGVYGLLAVIFAFLIPLLGGAIKAAVSTLALTSGPMGGILLLGMFVKRSTTKGAFIGLLLGLLLCLTMQVGNMTVTHHYKTNSLSLSECALNISALTNSTANNKVLLYENKRVCPLFKLSFATYGPIGLVTSFIFGYIFSLFFEEKEVDPKLLSDLVLRKDKSIKEELELQSPLNEDMNENNVKLI